MNRKNFSMQQKKDENILKAFKNQIHLVTDF